MEPVSGLRSERVGLRKMKRWRRIDHEQPPWSCCSARGRCAGLPGACISQPLLAVEARPVQDRVD